jgi:Protein of unknown function (DUF1236)
MQARFQRPLSRSAMLSCGLAVLSAVVAITLGAIEFGGDRWRADDRDVTGSIPGSVGMTGSSIEASRLPLSDEQRGHIFDGIMKLRDTPVADVPPPAPATALPGSVALQDMPANVTHDIPMVEGYKFVKLDDRILLVSPVDRMVVAELPRYRLIVD